MTRFEAARYLPELTSFQRDTVEHVTNRFYGPERSQRFLVADETGLGKTKVARGVIAHAIEELQDDPKVERIDIVYICSNADIAAQNLRRINITGNGELAFNSRLGLLARFTRTLREGRNDLIDKPINLVSFSPGTSFDFGHQLGRVDERALLHVLLVDRLELTGVKAKAAALIFQGTASPATFWRAVRAIPADDIDAEFRTAFGDAVTKAALDVRLRQLVDDLGRRRTIPSSIAATVRSLVGELRRTLAEVNVDALSPDLVILDEFQRFHHLLDAGDGAASVLAHRLFTYPDARVLLLSATPYKPFTYAEEVADNHRTSFLKTLSFLADGCESVSVTAVAEQLDRYRKAATSAQQVDDLVQEIRSTLIQVMTRQERPRHLDDVMLAERLMACDVREDDLVDYVRLRALAKDVGADLAMDYWKSVPYFANFMDSYQLGAKVREAKADPRRGPRVRKLLEQTNRLDLEAIRSGQEIDLGNARIRTLAGETTEAGWWKLLWLPPSLPYLRPDGPYQEPFAATITKRLIFSAWAAAPTAIASLLSYDADIRLGRTATTVRPLEYRSEGGPAALTTLAMFWPSPQLASLADPLKRSRHDLLDTAAMEEAVDRNDIEPARRALAEQLGVERDDPWLFAFAWESAVPDLDADAIVAALRGTTVAEDDEDGADASALDLLVKEVRAIAPGRVALGRRGAGTGVTLARLALHGPGNVAWRAFSRLTDGTEVTKEGHWQAAAILASGLRTLFNRPETTALLAQLMPGEDYRSAVLRYCAWGNLQSVLDEYLHHLCYAEGITVTDDASLESLATSAREAITLRPSRYTAHDPLSGAPIAFTSRFALRFGGRSGEEETARQPETRRAFNSPFWPFVLASTSVGQEGIDLHWWSHAVMHWNTPTNPVDFEQREGRVHRYAGHAVRRNVAHAHRAEILGGNGPDPWRAAYSLARDVTGSLGEFAPHWVYPGPAKIERHLAPYPLSQDVDRLEQVKTSRMLYRLTFGQPRQEDMIELLRRQGLTERPTAVDSMRIDLSPPPRSTGRPG